MAISTEHSSNISPDADRYSLKQSWLGALNFLPLVFMSTLYLLTSKYIIDGIPWQGLFYLQQYRLWLGHFILSSFLVAALAFYLVYFHRFFLKNYRKVVLLITVGVLTIVLSCLSFWISTKVGLLWQKAFLVPLILPLNALLCCVLLGTRIALFVTGVLLVILTSGNTFPEEFMIVNAIGYMVVILYASKLRKRRDIFKAFFFSWLCTLPISLGFHLIHGSATWVDFLAYVAGALGFAIASSTIAVVILPMLEYCFKLITNMTLIEFMDPNLELLRRLSIELPGTYQHCLVVGNLSELAAQAIGANGLFCRVATLYHDIGKLYNPHFFAENQTANFNIHQLLTPVESAQVIMAHIREGENIAKKQNLPRSFIDIIKEHHGTTLVYYFYYKQVELMGGDPAKVDETAFRYPGPKPRSKESAIIMLADSVEAASRSVESPDEDTMMQLVNRIVKEKVMDGQLDDCQLAFEELSLVKRSFVKTLMISRHMRVKYPKVPETGNSTSSS